MGDVSEGHTVKRFDGELAHVHQLVLEMGGLALDQVRRVLKALQDEDPELAREVVARDRQLNDMHLKIDEEIVRLLALRQPMAVDLRTVITTAKSVTDLERVGDQVKKVAHLVERLYDGSGSGSSPSWRLVSDIDRMARYSIDMLRKSLEAFDDLDVRKAVDVIEQNEELEEEFQSSLRRLATFVMEDSRTVGHYIDVVLGLRAVDRIGGHAKNIARSVVFVTTGRDVRHMDLETLMEEVLSDQLIS